VVAAAKPRPQADEPYPVTGWAWPQVDLREVETAAGDPARIVVDVREAYRYRGESEPIDRVAGHIPGAVNRPFVDNLDPQGRFLPPARLRDLYRDLVLDRDASQIVVHCGSGVTACHTLLALEVAGLSGAALYVGSWSEWSRNQLPIAVGP
jgi:thiosulfate/3-mercaptopyruvate sulfurtransferase